MSLEHKLEKVEEGYATSHAVWEMVNDRGRLTVKRHPYTHFKWVAEVSKDAGKDIYKRVNLEDLKKIVKSRENIEIILKGKEG